jgi:two-component system OmpR family response regulator
MRVLVVEDEKKIATAVGLALEGEGFRPMLSPTGEDGFFRASTERFDAIVLDRMLPGRDGLDILQALRTAGIRTPVLMLTAMGDVDHRVEGLTAGADDYLVKPFSMSELVARLRALLRRGAETAEVEVVVGDVRLDLPARSASRGSRQLSLTRTEWDLLLLLARAAGSAVSRDAIAHALWPDQARGASTDNLIDVHIGRLRKKLDPTGSSPSIQTIRGLGFRLGAES